MRRFTITLRCHITGRESEYKVSFPSAKHVYRYFKRKPDELLAIRKGWNTLPFHYRKDGLVSEEPSVPHYERNGWIQPAYDYKDDVLDFEY